MNLKATFHETALYWANRPLQYLIASGSALFGPVSYLPFNTTYFVNDIDIARAILFDTQHFSLAHAGGLGYLISEIMGKEAKALFNMENEEHLQLKHMLVKVLQPQYVKQVIEESLEPELEKARMLINNKENVDLVTLAKRCTSRLSCHMLGIPTHQKGFEKYIMRVAELSDEMSRMLSITEVYPTLQQKQKAQAIYAQFGLLIDQYYHSKSLLKNSIMAQIKERGMSLEEAKTLVITLIMAGTETVACAMPRICAILIDDQKWSKYSKNLTLIPKIVAEGMRITAPAPGIVHGVKQDTKIGNYEFRANRRVLIMLVNILRNSRFFPNAMNFDPDRTYNPSYRTFWFGAGPHYCLGTQLANQELAFIFNKLFSFSSDPTIIKRRYAKNTSFPGYSQLLINFSTR